MVKFTVLTSAFLLASSFAVANATHDRTCEESQILWNPDRCWIGPDHSGGGVPTGRSAPVGGSGDDRPDHSSPIPGPNNPNTPPAPGPNNPPSNPNPPSGPPVGNPNPPSGPPVGNPNPPSEPPSNSPSGPSDPDEGLGNPGNNKGVGRAGENPSGKGFGDGERGRSDVAPGKSNSGKGNNGNNGNNGRGR